MNPGSYTQTIDVGPATSYTFSQAVAGTRYYFAVRAYDGSANRSGCSNEVSWKINVAPTLGQPPDQTTAVGSSVSFQLPVTDDGDALTFSATGLPAGLSLDRSTGVIRGTPTTAGVSTVTVNVTDGLASATPRTFRWTIDPRLSVLSLSSNLASPQSAGTSIVFTTSAVYGVAPYQYKYLETVNGTTRVVRNWGGSASFNWAPSAANSYAITVWVRSAGSTADAAEAQATKNFSISQPLRLTSFTTSHGSPQPVGTTITLSAAASGGVAPYQYKFWVSANNGASWIVLRDWGATATYAWTPTQANSNYQLFAWARSAGSTADAAEASYFRSFAISAASPARLTGFTTSHTSPQPVGTSIGLSAAAAGGTAPYQFKFWISSNNGTSWTVLRDWGTSSTYTWTPTAANVEYQLFAWVRSAGATADAAEGSYFRTFAVTGGTQASPVRLTNFTTSAPSPQLVGTPITLAAAAAGGTGNYEFKFWVSSNSGATWSVLRNWSASPSYTWTPTSANPYYQLFAWVRTAGAAADVAEASWFRTFSITGGTTPARLTTFTTSAASPQRAGTAIVLTAGATDGLAPYEFKYWVSSDNGVTWSVLLDWSTSATYTWTPATANNYQLFAWVRSAGSSATIPESSYWRPFSITSGTVTSPARLVSFTMSHSSPQLAGTPITLSAAAVDGAAPYQYRFWVSTNNGLTWTVVRDWSTSSTYTWTPQTPNLTYQLFVWVRSAGATADAAEHSWFRTFTIR